MPRPLSPILKQGLARQGRVIAAICGFSFALNVLSLAMPLYTIQLYDRVMSSGSAATLIVITLAVAIALSASTFLENLRTRLFVLIGCRFDARLSADLFERQVEASVRSGGLSRGQALRELDTFRQAGTGGAALALIDLPWSPLFIAACFFIHPLIGALAVVGALALGGFALFNQWAVARPLAESAERAEASYRLTDTVLRNAEVVQAMGMLPDLAERWELLRGGLMERQAQASIRNSDLSGFLKLFRTFLQVTILAAGAWLVVDHQMSGGGLFAASMLTTRALLPIDQIVAVWRQIVQARTALAKVEASFADPARPQAMKLPAPKGAIAVEGLIYVPPGAKTAAISNLSFAIDAGDALGVVGASAAGKSTLARLIVGAVRPTQGVVRLDGADAWSWDRREFGKAVGYVPQDIELFDGSVKDNISRFRQADPHAIVEAAQLAGVHDMILRLPQGYETLIGATGANLSGGQRQRIALARAVFGRPRVVVMDEPNANLDGEGEAALQALIRQLKAMGSTVILIAHRPSALVALDKVLVLQGGALTAFGAVADILPQIAPGYPVPLRAVKTGAVA
jgi:PrtD family type I secretion system ABC transporter